MAWFKFVVLNSKIEHIEQFGYKTKQDMKVSTFLLVS